MTPLRLLPAHPQRQTGISLVEIMISMTIGLMIIITIGYAYVGASQSFKNQRALAQLQEGARYAFEFMAQDIRQAGSTGCQGSTLANVLQFNHAGTADDLDDNWYKNLFDSADASHVDLTHPDADHYGHPLMGFEDSAPPDVCTTANTAACYQRGDALTVLRVDDSEEFRATSAYSVASKQFNLEYNEHNRDLAAGTLMLATDCQHMAVFQVSAVGAKACVGGTCSVAINNDLNSGNTPANITSQLGVSADYNFPVGTRLYRLQAASYYVSKNNNEPALYRKILDAPASGSVSLQAEELVEGVRDMQILYGVDTTTPDANGNVDTYVTADQVATTAPGANNSERWRRVLSVRISLLMSSPAGDGAVTTKNQALSLTDGTAFDDRLLKRAFTTTIAVRNRL